MSDGFVRPKQIKEYAGICYLTALRNEKQGDFPKRRLISKGAVGWLKSELDEWMQGRKLASDVKAEVIQLDNHRNPRQKRNLAPSSPVSPD